MAGMRDPMFDPSLTVGIPEHLVVMLKESIVAAQKFGAATVSSGETTSRTRMTEQKEKVQGFLAALQAELSRRYEAGLELGSTEGR